ncbi:enoyl-CoA hydratase-related protein [Streptomyces sp. 15-116A]|uniref:enoyl-CoA hydratase-related protein n=1 Tax=Streptomyces sp. 15-116A TaxID=2259035 RepID=UPI0021B2F56C|nr:enoyl-CoA hydratase-related protein [Streptomyces sp. 15-116A]MCT7356887.1 enoyl-CoA hydratase-related protein [Streptomyces sp. 15-116A]
MEYRRIRVESTPGVLRVSLGAPALDARTVAELRGALDAAETDQDCRAVVLAGRPGVFCTGMDLRGALDDDHAPQEFAALLRRLTLVPRVVVAEVDGQVSGGGVGLVAAADLVHATPRSSFGLPEALWGLLPCVVLPYLARRIGPGRATTMALTTRPLDAAEACARGLVDEVGDQPDAWLAQLLVRLERIDARTLDAAKRYAAELWPVTEETGRLAARAFERLLTGPVARERLTGFVTTGRLPWESDGVAAKAGKEARA